jgi:hypothetical protein
LPSTWKFLSSMRFRLFFHLTPSNGQVKWPLYP